MITLERPYPTTPQAAQSAQPDPVRRAQMDTLKAATANTLSESFDRSEAWLLLGGCFDQAADRGYGLDPWPNHLDALIRLLRMLERNVGPALCGSAERLLVLKAKEQNLVASDYAAPPR